jgi:hypothetical protein
VDPARQPRYWRGARFPAAVVDRWLGAAIEEPALGSVAPSNSWIQVNKKFACSS